MIKEARDLLLKGISTEETNPEVVGDTHSVSLQETRVVSLPYDDCNRSSESQPCFHQKIVGNHNNSLRLAMHGSNSINLHTLYMRKIVGFQLFLLA
jgi:hypothetical protein